MNRLGSRGVAAGIVLALAVTGAPGWAEEAGTPPAVRVGHGQLVISGLMQVQYVADFTRAPTGAEDAFRLRRMEWKLAGRINDHVSWFGMVDPVRSLGGDESTAQEKRILQDFGIVLGGWVPFSTVEIGQQKVPFGMEGLESSARLDAIERAAMTSVFKWSDFRDLGVQVQSAYGPVRTTLAVLNGEGQNAREANQRQDVAGRIVVEPVQGVRVGGAHYEGDRGARPIRESRSGGEGSIEIGPVFVRGEFAAGTSGGVWKRTAYGTLGVRPRGSLVVMARVDWWDPRTGRGGDERLEITGGVSWLQEAHHAKASVNYVARLEKPSLANDLVRVQLQVAF